MPTTYEAAFERGETGWDYAGEAGWDVLKFIDLVDVTGVVEAGIDYRMGQTDFKGFLNRVGEIAYSNTLFSHIEGAYDMIFGSDE